MSTPARSGRPDLTRLALIVATMVTSLVAPGAGAAPDLAADLKPLLRDRCLRSWGTGLSVIDLERGEEVFQYRADRPLVPASNLKLFTAAVALRELGPDHRFVTRIGLDGDLDEEGTLEGDLVLLGGGDPFLMPSDLRRMAEEVHRAGLRRVRGELVVDDSLFDARRRGRGWRDRSQKWYNAPIGALSLHFNTVQVHVNPGDRAGAVALVSTTPEVGVQVGGDVRTRRSGARSWVGARRQDAGRLGIPLVRVRGGVARDRDEINLLRTISDPPRFAGNVLLSLLRERGIEVSGGLRWRGASAPGGAGMAAWPRVRWIATHHSPPLTELVYWMEKFSNNFIAEMLLKAVGARETPPGSAGAGVARIEAFLRQAGIDLEGFRMVDGSGLSPQNRVTAGQLARLLARVITDWRIGPDFVAALPRAGDDGTLRKRLEHLDAGFVRAKTGTISGVSSLAGYAGGERGPRYAFAMILNGARCGVVASRDRLDRVARRLARAAATSDMSPFAGGGRP